MTGLDDRALDETPPLQRTWLRPAHVAFLAALVLLVGALGRLAGQQLAPTRTVADPISIGFLRDMQTHHAQAVAMSTPMHRRSGDPEVTTLAFDILSTQQGQIGIMSGWLDLSDDTEGADDAPMAWMGEAHDGPMPGMASPEQVAALDTLPISRATEQYLRLMIRHHRGALTMAKYAADNAEHGNVRLLAQSMYDGQASEIQVLQDMLAARGHAREPEQNARAHDGTTHSTEQQPTDSSATGGGSHGGHG